MVRPLAILVFLGALGCASLVPDPGVPVSWGHSSDGFLRRGASLSDSGEGFVRARPGEDTRHGTPELVAALTRAAAEVARAYPGGAPLRIGDLSSVAGGQHPRHRSHRSGRDADLIFYVVDSAGRSSRGRGWLAFDRFGIARETVAPGDGEPSNDVFFLDEARNWHLVRTLLLDPEANVQWIFCSQGVKARLLSYAIATEPVPEAILRASWVLHQPSRGEPHDDHFHVRVACTPEGRSEGCVGRGPIWPWIRRDVEKPAEWPGTNYDDAELVDALLTEPPEGAALARRP